MSQSPKGDTSESVIGQLVTFKLEDEEIAVPIRLVQEIIRVPEITKVPAAPSYVDGIGNLRGDLLPIVNLRKRLGLDPRATDEQTRVVVLRSNGHSTGIIVDSVSEVISIDEKILENPPQSVASINGQYLKSIAKVDEGKRLILILDESRVLPELKWQTKGETMEAGTQQESRSQARNADDTEQMVTFNVGSEEYAINIMQVKEIIRVTEITPVPKAPPYIVGVMSLRNNLLPIMDLRVRFSMEQAESTENRRIVVVDLNGTLTGIQVDAVSQVLTVEKAKIENPPSIVKSEDADCLKGVAKLDGGKRILMLLNVLNLIQENDQGQVQAAVSGNAQTETAQSQDGSTDEAQLVCFRIAAEEYALDIMKVQEIIRLRDVTTVPHARSYMEGIINLRGTVVPVIDMRTRFGLDKSERNEHNRIVIVSVGGKVTGLIVDSVTEVIRVPTSQIETAPQTVSKTEDEFIDGVGKLDEGKRILILIKADSLLESDEHQAA